MAEKDTYHMFIVFDLASLTELVTLQPLVLRWYARFLLYRGKGPTHCVRRAFIEHTDFS
jgi:hypothetical protein